MFFLQSLNFVILLDSNYKHVANFPHYFIRKGFFFSAFSIAILIIVELFGGLLVYPVLWLLPPECRVNQKLCFKLSHSRHTHSSLTVNSASLISITYIFTDAHTLPASFFLIHSPPGHRREGRRVIMATFCSVFPPLFISFEYFDLGLFDLKRKVFWQMQSKDSTSKKEPFSLLLFGYLRSNVSVFILFYTILASKSNFLFLYSLLYCLVQFLFVCFLF